MTVTRRPGAASAAVLLALGASLVAAHLIAPEWSRRTGLDVWNAASANDLLLRATDERDAVQTDADRAASRRETANQIAAQLIDGDTTLPAATDEMLEVFRDDVGMKCVLETINPDAQTERHRFARHTIERVKRVLPDDPARRAAVVERLEAEYCAMCPSPDAPGFRR